MRSALGLLTRQRETTVFVVAVVLLLYFGIKYNSTFVSSTNLANLLSETASPIIIIAIGEVFLLICGEIDLSVGFVYTFAPFLMHYLIDFYHVPPLPAIIISLLFGLVVGAANGFLTVTMGLPSFITTLGTGFILLGLTLTTSHAYPANIPAGSVSIGRWIGAAPWSQFIWAIVLTAIFYVVLNRTKWGLYTVATGGNQLGAREAGVKTGRIKYGNFMICATLGALVGLQNAFYTNTIDPSAGGYQPMFYAVTAAVIGGTAMLGGQGTILGAFLGGDRPRHPHQRPQRRGDQRQPPGHRVRGGHPAVHDRQRPARAAAGRREELMTAEPTPATPVPGADDDVLRVEHISKRFGAVLALHDVNLHLRRGEVLGLLGDNGAGKSTLIKIICGFQPSTSGRVILEGKEVSFKSVDQARTAGIDTVYQDLALINELTVYHNMFLNRERTRMGLLNNRSMRKTAKEQLDRIGISLQSVDSEVAKLSGGQRQAIAVARAVTSNAKVLLLDEPLAAMGAKEGALVLELVKDLKAQGQVSIIMIMHNYGQALEVCDRINLLQHGEITFDKLVKDTSVQELNDIVIEEYRRALKERPAVGLSPACPGPPVVARVRRQAGQDV